MSLLLEKILLNTEKPFKNYSQDSMGRPLLSSDISELYKIKMVKNNSQKKNRTLESIYGKKRLTKFQSGRELMHGLSYRKISFTI